MQSGQFTLSVNISWNESLHKRFVLIGVEYLTGTRRHISNVYESYKDFTVSPFHSKYAQPIKTNSISDISLHSKTAENRKLYCVSGILTI